MRLPDYDYAQGGGYFITIDSFKRVPLFGRMDDGHVILNEVGAMVQLFWLEQPQHYPGVVLDAFVVMPEHVHGIVILVDPRLTEHGGPDWDPATTPRIDSQEGGPDWDPAPTPGVAEHPPDGREYYEQPIEAAISIPRRPIDLRLLMQNYKSLTSQEYYKIRQRYPQSRLPDRLWQRSYYERVIRSESDFNEKREYISTNPQRRFLKSSLHDG
jgi:REP element-mobilizing transposase RayT